MPPSTPREPEHVRAMFSSIARRYDLLNHLLSLNLDRRWRRRAVRELQPRPAARVLDLCGGTGDLSLEVTRHDPELVVCCDFSHAMLARAAPKFRRRGVGQRCGLIQADALQLPFPDGCFDGVIVGFGVRNLVDMPAGFREMQRVLRPGGRLVVLEFSQPRVWPLSSLYRLYLERLLPRLGDGVSGRSGPYGYLARTIREFPEPSVLAGQIRDAGFAAAGWTTLTGGIVAIHTALKA